MIAWLAKFDIRFYCKQCTEVMRTINLKKNGIKAINNSSVLETKTSSQLQENAWVYAGSFFMVTWHRVLTSTKGWDFPWLQPCSRTFMTAMIFNIVSLLYYFCPSAASNKEN